MTNVRLIHRPAFQIVGLKTWISGPDNESFGRFWEQCRANGLLQFFREVQHQTHVPTRRQIPGACLGVSRVIRDPARRAFDYMIAIEVPEGWNGEWQAGALERYEVPESEWAVFACRGKLPEALVAAEVYAFTEWLPNSSYRHALAPELEVYPAQAHANSCEFWLPIEERLPARHGNVRESEP